MRKLKACWDVAMVVLLSCLVMSPAAAGGGSGVGRIESSEDGTTLNVGNDSEGGLSIESVSEGSAGESAERGDDGDGRVRLSVAAASQEDGGALPAPEEQAFTVGKRATVFKDTYTISYIDRMRLNERGEREPVLADVEFGRWLDIAVNEVGEDGVTATVYFVRKRPVNVDRDADGPQLELPEANYNMVSRDIRLTPGRREQLRITGDNSPVGLQLGMPR